MAHEPESTTPEPLPRFRDELMALHAEARRRRNTAAPGSKEQADAIDLLGRIEVEIARVERAMDPPRV
jgi:hypothetical protein